MAERILVVDDEGNMAKAVAKTLALSGYDCHWFLHPTDVLTDFKSKGADLVITDQRMPEMDGVTLMQNLHGLNPQLPVIIMTAYGGIPMAVKAMKEGAFDYVTKPFDNTELRALVQRALVLKRLEAENHQLRIHLGEKSRTDVVAESQAFKDVLALVERAAPSAATVLIQGESGTGKEIVAKRVHFLSPRVGRPFVAVNCKAFAEGVLESELFGHEKGAFTGAGSQKLGCFERAHGGTLFLDEIGETTPAFQAKLLRIIQEREVLRVGGSQARKIDVRLIAATNRNLGERVAAGKFREDLFFRLNVIPVHLPPLRERVADILPLARFFLERYAARSGQSFVLSSEAAQVLLNHAWPGNVRELENVMERATVLAKATVLEPEDLLMDSLRPKTEDDPVGFNSLQSALDQAARVHIQTALDRCNHHKAETANLLGIDRTTLYRFMKKLGLN